jgi:hypothetical protein
VVCRRAQWVVRDVVGACCAVHGWLVAHFAAVGRARGHSRRSSAPTGNRHATSGITDWPRARSARAGCLWHRGAHAAVVAHCVLGRPTAATAADRHEVLAMGVLSNNSTHRSGFMIGRARGVAREASRCLRRARVVRVSVTTKCCGLHLDAEKVASNQDKALQGDHCIGLSVHATQGQQQAQCKQQGLQN